MKKTQLKIFVLTAALVLPFSVAALADCNDFPGAGTPEDPFLISTSEDLQAMSETDRLGRSTADLVFCAQASYKLTADIDMAGYDWWPIGDSSLRIFRGDFNGAGHTIYNLGNIAIYSYPAGLFGWLAGSVYDLNLSNVNFQAITIGTDNGVGGVAGTLYTNGVIENVNVSGVITVGHPSTDNGRNAGGIVGVVVGPDARISNTNFSGSIVGVTSYADFLGGIIGYVSQQALRLTVSDCFSSGTITRPDVGGGLYIGKIAGGWDTAAIVDNPPTFNFCYSNMTIDAHAAWDRPWAGYDGIELDSANLQTVVWYADSRISVENVHKLAVATLWLTVEEGTPLFLGKNGFEVLDSEFVDGFYRVMLYYPVAGGKGFTSIQKKEIVSITGAKGVVAVGARLSGYAQDGTAIDFDVNLEEFEQPVVPVNYDLTGDGVIDQLDLVIALSFYMAEEGDANWNLAKASDFNKDGKVNLIDFIMLLQHMEW